MSRRGVICAGVVAFLMAVMAVGSSENARNLSGGNDGVDDNHHRGGWDNLDD